MTGMKRDVVLRELSLLGSDLGHALQRDRAQARRLIGPVIPQNCTRIFLVGCGDSWHAGWAAREAFSTLAGVELCPVSANDFLLATPPTLVNSVVIGISASGATARVIEAINLAKKRQCRVVGISCQPDAALFQHADGAMMVGVDSPQPAPGIRTYQASYTALLCMALEFGLARGRLNAADEAAMEHSHARVAQELDSQTARCRNPESLCDEPLIKRMASAPLLHVLGSGSAFGSALHAAAKFAEIAGKSCIAKDLEEWWHVDRFGFSDECLLVVFMHAGEQTPRQLSAVARLGNHGVRPYLVGPQKVLAQVADPTLLRAALADDIPQTLQPLIDAHWSAAAAAHLATAMNVHPFNNLFNRRSIDECAIDRPTSVLLGL